MGMVGLIGTKYSCSNAVMTTTYVLEQQQVNMLLMSQFASSHCKMFSSHVCSNIFTQQQVSNEFLPKMFSKSYLSDVF